MAEKMVKKIKLGKKLEIEGEVLRAAANRLAVSGLEDAAKVFWEKAATGTLTEQDYRNYIKAIESFREIYAAPKVSGGPPELLREAAIIADVVQRAQRDAILNMHVKRGLGMINIPAETVIDNIMKAEARLSKVL